MNDVRTVTAERTPDAPGISWPMGWDLTRHCTERATSQPSFSKQILPLIARHQPSHRLRSHIGNASPVKWAINSFDIIECPQLKFKLSTDERRPPSASHSCEGRAKNKRTALRLRLPVSVILKLKSPTVSRRPGSADRKLKVNPPPDEVWIDLVWQNETKKSLRGSHHNGRASIADDSRGLPRLRLFCQTRYRRHYTGSWNFANACFATAIIVKFDDAAGSDLYCGRSRARIDY